MNLVVKPDKHTEISVGVDITLTILDSGSMNVVQGGDLTSFTSFSLDRQFRNDNGSGIFGGELRRPPRLQDWFWYQ